MKDEFLVLEIRMKFSSIFFERIQTDASCVRFHERTERRSPSINSLLTFPVSGSRLSWTYQGCSNWTIGPSPISPCIGCEGTRGESSYFSWTKEERKQRYNVTENTWNEMQCSWWDWEAHFLLPLFPLRTRTGNAYFASRVIGAEGVADVATPPRRVNRIWQRRNNKKEWGGWEGGRCNARRGVLQPEISRHQRVTRLGSCDRATDNGRIWSRQLSDFLPSSSPTRRLIIAYKSPIASIM